MLCSNSDFSIKDRELLVAVRQITRKFEDNDQKIGFFRSFFKNPIDREIVNNLCLKLHVSLTYLIANYDEEKINVNEYLSTIEELKSIKNQYFQGEDWSALQKILQYLTISLFVFTVFMLVLSLPQLPVCAALTLICAFGLDITESYEFNHSIATALTPFIIPTITGA